MSNNNCAIGKGCDFEQVNLAEIVVPNGGKIPFNIKRNNNTKEFDRCGCCKDFIHLNENTGDILLDKAGTYLVGGFVSGTVIAPATAVIVAVTDNEGIVENFAPSVALTGVSIGTRRIKIREEDTTLSLINVSGAALTIPVSVNGNPTAEINITYEGK